ncbi:MAG: transcription termination/antitermination protein NusG [Coriobacteriales bacterium]|jgi:transcriptional antiterminator NusG|nr:transcription termination/antitermination protein NusG [Coriobacteriales bacterium]
MAKKWYVLHTYSGYENRVKRNIEHRIEALDCEGKVFDIQIPSEEVVEIKDGGRRVAKKKNVFPGYVLVQLQAERKSDGKLAIDERTWSLVRDTPGVTGFVGAQGKPTPLSREEYNKIMKHSDDTTPKRTSSSLSTGMSVKVVSGALADFDGRISEVNPEAGKIKVLVSIFGRETPVELSYDQVTRL